VRDGLRVSGVPTSRAAAAAAKAAGIPLIDLTEGMILDLTVDGADEVTPTLDLIKGWGGALVRERIVAQASRAQVILVGAEKLVPALGVHGRIPVEVIPFAAAHVAGSIRMFGLEPSLRCADHDAMPFVTDNGNVLLDCAPAAPLASAAVARDLERRLLAIAGVVDTGLFLGTAERVLVGHPDGHVEVMAGLRGVIR
jgi:ribose 5-phosphate isomerase A